MKVTLMSFGYKYKDNPKGDWKDNKVFDVRKGIRNPWHIGKLRKLTGLDKEVQDFIRHCNGTKHIIKWAGYMIESYGYSKLSIGCHGGRHRSVAVVEMLAEQLRTEGYEVTVIHRDLNKEST